MLLCCGRIVVYVTYSYCVCVCVCLFSMDTDDSQPNTMIFCVIL